MLKVKNLKKTYTVGDFKTKAVDDLSIEFRQTEFVAILGPSGCGKTTLLNILGALDRPDSGEISLHGNSLTNFKNIELDMYRNNSLGFIFQTHNLVSHLSIIENVEMGMTLSGVGARERHERAKELLTKVGLLDHINKRPNQLSVGQSQRVAIARALANNPDIILADEPTGSVDSKTSHQIMELIREVSKDKLVIMVTHDVELAKQYATRIVRLNDGKIESDSHPYDSSKEEIVSKELVLKKTAMSFTTSFIGALKNLRMKLGRTILTAVASSIGIIGIALILALSTGMNNEVDKFQTETLGNFPITISEIVFDLEKLQGFTASDFEEFPESNQAIAYTSDIIASFTWRNQITTEYVDYVKGYFDNDGASKISGISYKNKMDFTILNPVNNPDNTTTYNIFYSESTTPSPSPMPGRPSILANLLPDGDIFDDVYDVIAGNKPTSDPQNKKFDVVLTVDQYNRIKLDVLEKLGFEVVNNDLIPFTELIGKTLHLHPGVYDADTFNVNDSITLTISGIVRIKEENTFTLFGDGIGYTSDLTSYLATNHPESVGTIEAITIYPVNFKAKEDVKVFLDKYNLQYEENDPANIRYSDDSQIITNISKTIIDSVSIGLIAFTSISLVVSSIMIAIITYTSVIERTKEIGLMRALGARKKDVSRTFNSENIIIGFAAGLFGIIITFILTFPLNAIISHYADVNNIAQVKLLHAIILIAISVFLAFIAGLIPSRIASNKDPVAALRVE